MIKIDALEKLSSLLLKLIQVQKKLLELELLKKEALISGDLERLDEILILGQPLVMNSQSLEKQREKLQHDMGLFDVTLKQIINDYDANNTYLLKSRFDELSVVLIKLKKVNLVNMAVLNSRVTTLNKIFSLIDVNRNNNIYEKDGHIKQKENKNTRELV